MKIFYAVQATGNGHIARAIEILPHLQKHGEVSVLLSGGNSHLNPNLPVRFRSKGISLFYGASGGLDYAAIWKHFSFHQILSDAKSLPLKDYDIIINDFDAVTALACHWQKVPSINFGHQASFYSNKVPRPSKKDVIGEWILTHFAPATARLGLHFEPFDTDITVPVIKQNIIDAEVNDLGHVAVYLPQYPDRTLSNSFSKLTDVRFEIFSKSTAVQKTERNLTFLPITNDGFANSMIGSKGVITGAGFETPAEALYLNKRLLCLPIIGQYEQACNAEALKRFDVKVVDKISMGFENIVSEWLQAPRPRQLILTENTQQIVERAIGKWQSNP